MNDTTQLTNEAANLLGDLRAMLEKGGQFVMEQAPPLAKEIIAFGRAMNTFQVCAALIVALIAGTLLAKRGKNWFEDDAIPQFMGSMALLIGSILTFLFSISNFFKVWFAPRLYLLDYVAHALRGGCR